MNLIITDLERGEDDPGKFIRICKELFPEITIMILSTHTEETLLEEGKDADFALSTGAKFNIFYSILDHILFNRPLDI